MYKLCVIAIFLLLNLINFCNNENINMYLYEKYMSIIGPVTNIMFYLQAYKIFTSKSAQDVSGVGFFMSFIGLSSWLIYGVLLKNKPLIIANLFGVTGAILTLLGILMYGNFSF